LKRSDDGKLWIVEFPSKVHEKSAGEFEWEFRRQVVDGFINFLRTVTVQFNGSAMEADATFGTLPNLPNSVRPQALQPGQEWITFVVEVARTQTWTSLREKAQDWCDYPGMKYVLLISVSPKARHMEYEFYSVVTTAANQNTLLLVSSDSFWHTANANAVPPPAPVPVTLDIHHILGIPQDQLPVVVAGFVTVDLRVVLNSVMRGM
jgi:Putative restriction endonuclease